MTPCFLQMGEAGSIPTVSGCRDGVSELEAPEQAFRTHVLKPRAVATECGARLSWRVKVTLGFSIGPFVQAFKLPRKGLLYLLPCPVWSRVLGFRALSGEDPGHLISPK